MNTISNERLAGNQSSKYCYNNANQERDKQTLRYILMAATELEKFSIHKAVQWETDSDLIILTKWNKNSGVTSQNMKARGDSGIRFTIRTYYQRTDKLMSSLTSGVPLVIASLSQEI
ncbi:Hypothetical predicted protein [Octopus vulgaris]|uniref:Uncharacterized protein n=1 Tax=Octopus vulgaris TaxID=6645 RepID=A0AA36B7K6_OCTVU|nr:Hypothetical predicted protein [Octopus vulgaris]